MKTRLGALIVAVGLLWGCGGTAPTEPVVPAPDPSPSVTPIPQPTPPPCRIHKLCEESAS